jgi:single-stranded-DNA-specific exonuclease
LQPSVRVDAELPLDMLDARLAKELRLLEPFGHGNHEPVLMTRHMSVVEQRRLANKLQNGIDHMKLRVDHPRVRGGIDALFWRAWGRAGECPVDGRIDACFTLELNSFNGHQNVQLNLRDLRSCAE